ncbi:hypothetical protein ACIBXA_28990 [Micromonospora echinaurantiaca]|uniref:hypothetical protein n=1 Tax=Micromonospora echinaurantiaca TaxID=47857 RepID=UPI0037AB4CA6
MTIDFTQPPSPRERQRLEVRLRRLYAAQESYARATANLATLAKTSTTSSVVAKTGWVRVRDPFVYRPAAAPGDWSDRKLPPKELRPPAARLGTPRGAALRLLLIALFEAQTRTRAGGQPDNPRPLQAPGDVIAWADLLATDAKPSGKGRTYMSVAAKKGRHLFSAIELLHDEDLVALPNGDASRNKHDGFLLNHEGGKRVSGPNDVYVVPRMTEAHLLLPLGLFTHGWIHVLEDSELRYLLMLCYFHRRESDGFKVPSETRLLHMGIGPDAYERHTWFSRFDLNEVTIDKARHFNGTVDDYGDGGVAIPHTLRLLPEGFEQDALMVVSTAVEDQLAR